jgi:uncharacterized protein YbcV (DUF1398 family)
MFTIQQIQEAHSNVKSGADFPTYIQDLKKLGVHSFVTYVVDSHTEYWGENNYHTASTARYANLNIADEGNKEQFINYLKIHQQGATDYITFCNHCAETGIEKWIVDIEKLTCTYYDLAGNEILAELIPGN